MLARPSVKNMDFDPDDLRTKADELNAQNDFRSAVKLYREYLAIKPYDVGAMNELACCLSATGDDQTAAKIFEQAFKLDDSNLAVSVNYASVLKNRWLTDNGLAHLRRARIHSPAHPNINAVYGALRFAVGDAVVATRHALTGWLGIFDSLRMANSYLFTVAYADIDEKALASEHKFWAETLRAPSVTQQSRKTGAAYQDMPHEPGKRVRIGYWSPDLRDHSVRLFFRPLLEGHDRSKFEIYIYHDSLRRDQQTQLIENCCDGFFDVSITSDQELCDLIWSHQLDVLVEMAGHTSTNRAGLLQLRMAKLQVSGIAYPPTTGLSSIDVKLTDVHINDENSAFYYTENAGILPSSFWCFDPKEEVSAPAAPPVIKNGFITYGCVGNIAKINSRIVACWAKILLKAPTSKLLIRAINFNDPAAERELLNLLQRHRIDKQRIILKKPEANLQFFESYNEIDILLDTFPFNGGTTTCFATYMGVPVVSWAGASLISRMGKSVMENLGLHDWIVRDAGDYVERAVAGAADIEFLVKFRNEVRGRYANCALGNGKMFASDLEALFVELLQQSPSEIPRQDAVEPLAAAELMRRAYFVMRYGQFEGARRIVDYCLRAHPECGTAHVLWTERLTSKGDFNGAIDYLRNVLPSLHGAERLLAYVNLVRFFILEGRLGDAESMLVECRVIEPGNLKDRLQVRLLEAFFLASEHVTSDVPMTLSFNQRVKVVVVNDDEASFLGFCDGLRETSPIPDGLSVEFVRCDEASKFDAYASSISGSTPDICIWMQRNVQIRNPNFWIEVIGGLVTLDVMGISGAQTWSQLDWNFQAFEKKTGSFLVPSGEKPDFHEVHFWGGDIRPVCPDMSILGGSLLALRPDRLGSNPQALLDSQLAEGALWMEEFFSYQIGVAGARLGVHQGLGVVVDWREALAERYIGEARIYLSDLMEFDPFLFEDEDRSVASVPASSVDVAFRAQQKFLSL